MPRRGLKIKKAKIYSDPIRGKYYSFDYMYKGELVRRTWNINSPAFAPFNRLKKKK